MLGRMERPVSEHWEALDWAAPEALLPAGSGPVPGREVPGIDVPAAVVMHQAGRRRRDAGARQQRQDDMGLAEDLVDLDQQRGALVGVKFLLGRSVGA